LDNGLKVLQNVLKNLASTVENGFLNKNSKVEDLHSKVETLNNKMDKGFSENNEALSRLRMGQRTAAQKVTKAFMNHALRPMPAGMQHCTKKVTKCMRMRVGVEMRRLYHQSL
jgi:hypothetical protein